MFRLLERCTFGFKPESPKPSTWSEVMVPLRVSEKRSRGSRIGTVGFAGLAAPTAGDPESRLRLSGALLSFSCRRLVSHVNYPDAQQPTPRGSQRRTAAWGAGPLASGSAHAQSLPPACPGAVQQSALPLGPARHARTRAATRAPRGGRGQRGRHGGKGRRRRRRPRCLRRGSSSPSRSPSALPEPCEGETLSPGMQREEGFNTKMADGPDEYETEAGCVPLLHPEVRNGAEPIPSPAILQPFSPGLAGGGGLRVRGSGTRGSWGGRGGKSRPERGCERITGEEIAGRARPGRALGRRPWLCLEDRGGDVDGSTLSPRYSRVHWRRGPGACLEPHVKL